MDLLSEYSRKQLITTLHDENVYLIHVDFDPEEDMSEKEHLESVKSLTHDAIKEEILESIEAENDNQDEGDSISFSDYMNRWLY